MAHQFDHTLTTVAGSVQPASGWQKYVRRILLGYGQSGMKNLNELKNKCKSNDDNLTIL